MPEIPATLKPRLQAWWTSLDDGTHTIFEAIYMEAPAAVSRAISGGQWVADAPEPGLSAQLGGDAASNPFTASNQIPAITIADQLRMPTHVAVSTPVELKWTEYNYSSVEAPAYFTDVYIEDTGEQVVASARLTNPPLAAGASAERSFQFDGAATEGAYTVRLYMNAEGIDPGTGVPGPQGYRGVYGAQFVAGMNEQEADKQNDQIWLAATYALSNAAAEPTPAGAIAKITEALNWLSAHDQLTDGERKILEDAIAWAASTNLQRVTEPDGMPDDRRERVQALTGAATATQATGHSEQARKQVFDALNRLVAE
ncbi:MAG TPA: hypothetical protein VHC23_05040 [Jatrophihabitans sp.]|nr:hypothetical protein [Jatrophihabitans sp.]